MRTLFAAGLIVGLVAWIFVLQRRLQAERMRSDMYRDIAGRLDRKIVELSGRGA